ncbi:unnamed protein product [Camellia sinensis]
MADLTSDLRNLATMADGLVTEGSPSPKGSSHIVKDLLLERDFLTLMDIVKRNGGKNQSSASEIVLGMSPRASIGVQSEVPTPSSFVEAMGGLCWRRALPLFIRSTATNVEIELPVPANATNPNVWTSLGSASYAPENDALIWKIKSFLGGKEYMLRAEYTLPSITSEDAAPERKASIRVKFEIPYFVVSGIQTKVRYLKIIEKSGYQALPCVRYITMAGEYASFGPEYAYPQGVYNPHMGQHYLQIYGVPSTVNTNIVPYGQMGHPLSGNHGYPTIQVYVTPGRNYRHYYHNSSTIPCRIFVMQISSFSSLLGRTQISSLKMILDFYQVFSQDKSIYEAMENAFITIYVRKIPVETAKNLLHFAIDSNIGDLAALEFIVGALVSKGDITTSTVLIDTDHCYCVILNADGGVAFPSEKTAQDCSSSDISSLKINTGSGKTEKTKVKIKMVIELLEGIHFVSSVEAISLGAQAGIHPWIIYDIISNAAGNSWVFKNHWLDESIMPDGFLSNLKGIVLDMAKSCTFPLPLLAVAFQHLIAGSSHGHGNDGDDTLIKAWEKVYGVNITNAVNMLSLLICYSSGSAVMLLLLLRCCGDAAVMVFVTIRV